jgi:hypothetical protein
MLLSPVHAANRLKTISMKTDTHEPGLVLSYGSVIVPAFNWFVNQICPAIVQAISVFVNNLKAWFLS